MTAPSIHRESRRRLVACSEIDHHVADLTMTASADVTLQRLQDKLAQADQWLPIDGDPRLSLGTLVETNSSGPLRLGFGAWRDLLLGSQFITQNGQLITAGGRTMKNVAGYDLTKFVIGQHGVFAKVQTITTRTYKRPAAALLASFAESDQLTGELLPTPCRPHWSMLADNKLYCGYLGNEHAINFYESQVRRREPREVKRQSLQDDIDFRAAHWLPERTSLTFRAAVPPSRILEFAKRAGLSQYAADAAFGIVVGPYSETDKFNLCQAADAVGGKVFFAQDAQNFYGATGPEMELLNRLQSAFNA
ncbi:MAG TPA: FAD-binding oxidoreductase [Tepidisphaeraceae bacterium]|nr:FAD-binding oxidoreductase [Tepidisphaeraceae bacterium]